MFALRRAGAQAFSRRLCTAELDTQRKRLIFRSKQRGWLELDVLLGNFAARNVGSMTEAQMEGYQEVLDMEAPDLFKWLSGQKPFPLELQDHEVLNMMKDYIMHDSSASKQDKDP
eukprot:GEMP01034829.1.p1 GENE.GEMP01034829.1~~GEMP01034829.1.p1  ORF type:complete len:115 (-),score=28.68 GEMP01034829.1:1580-1924(-)